MQNPNKNIWDKFQTWKIGDKVQKQKLETEYHVHSEIIICDMLNKKVEQTKSYRQYQVDKTLHFRKF